MSEDFRKDFKSLRNLTDKEAIVRVEGDYTEATSDKNDAIGRANRYDNIYQALDPPDDAIDETSGLIDDDESLYSNTYLPIGASMVDSASAQLFNLLFSSNQYMSLDADDFMDGFAATLVQAHLMKRHKEMAFKKMIYTVIQDALIFDYAVTGTRWLLEGGYVPKRRKQTETINLGNIKLDRQTVKGGQVWTPDKIDRSDVFKLNFKRCYHDSTAQEGLKDSRYFFDDRDVMVEDLIDNAKEVNPHGRYKNIDKVIESIVKGSEAQLGALETRDQKQSFINSRRVVVGRCWTRDHLIEFAQGYIIRRKNMPGWVLQIWKTFNKPNKFEGMGLLQRLERNQIDINSSLNSRRNLQNLISQPFAVVDRELMAESDGEPRLYPGWVGQSSGGRVQDKIYVYTPGADTNVGSMADVQTEISVMERSAGVSENAQAAVSSSRTSATEVGLAAAGMANRITIVAEMMELNLEDIYQQQFLLEQEFLSREESFKYNGKYGDEFFTVDPSIYMWNTVPRFTAKGSLDAAKDPIETQQFMAMVDRLLQMAPLTGTQVNWDNIITEMFRRLAPKNYTSFIKDPTIPEENIPPETENMLFAMGRDVRVSPLNDNAQHAQVHSQLKTTPDYKLWTEQMRNSLNIHIQQHLEAGTVAQASAGRSNGLQDSADGLRGLRPTGPGVTQ